MGKTDVSAPRKMFRSTDVGGTTHCPECQPPLENENQTYLVAVGIGRNIDPFIFANDGGYFCTQCPVVVLDYDEFEECAIAAVGGSYRIQVAVAGIIDWDAVPESKRDMPIGDDENPIPLVEFSNRSSSLESPRERSVSRSERKRRRRRKGRRRRR